MEGKVPAFFRRLFRIGRREDPILERYLRRNREALDRQRRESDVSRSDSHLMEELPVESPGPEAPSEDEEVLEQLDEPPSALPDPNQGSLLWEPRNPPTAGMADDSEARDSVENNVKRRSHES